MFASRGYTVAEAGFISTKEFNFKWKLRGSSISIYVSDYLDDAPDIVIEQFLKGASTYIFGGRHIFGDDYLRYMRSEDFILRKRPVYFKRCRRLTRSDMGEHRNLFDSVQRLLDMGLLDARDIDNTVFSWTTGSNRTKLGYCAQMFRIVVISSIFDDPKVPEELLDYVVFHECLHLRQGYRPFNRRPHDAEFQRQERMFPRYEEMESQLKSLHRMAKS